MSEVVAALLWSCIDWALVLTGKLVVTMASFGRWRGERLQSDESRTFCAAGALWYQRDGQRVVSATGLLFAGVLFYTLLALLFIGYFSPD